MESLLNENDLKKELESFKEKFPKLSLNDLFNTWFLRAFITEDEDAAIKALTGKTNDKAVDAILIDEKLNLVIIVQGKYRKYFSKSSEKRADVFEFADLANNLTGTEEEFNNYIKTIDPNLENRLREVRRKLKKGYKLQLYYLTTGKCANNLCEEAINKVKHSAENASLMIVQGKQVLLLLSDYISGVAPPVPNIDLEMESGSGVAVKGTLNRYDNNTKIESWVFSMNGHSVGEIFQNSGVRIFARNVRGFLGSTEINRNMEKTLKEEPEYFWYYNNGITIICDQAEKRSQNGKDILSVTNPQIINGQQTTRTLARVASNSSIGSVIVRVIRVPRDIQGVPSNFEALVSNIVSATNWQNQIRPSDLRSNDQKQIAIERQLRKLDFHYIRKRQSKSEAQREVLGRHFSLIKKEELAQAVAACDLDPLLVRQGKEGLFEEYYDSIFPNTDPNYYLNRYFLMRNVGYVASGYPERAYAKWLVVNFVWKYLKITLRSDHSITAFRNKWITGDPMFGPFNNSIKYVFNSAINFYRKNRGSGQKAADVSTFFMRRNLHILFAKYWNSSSNQYKTKFNNSWKKFESKLNS